MEHHKFFSRFSAEVEPHITPRTSSHGTALETAGSLPRGSAQHLLWNLADEYCFCRATNPGGRGKLFWGKPKDRRAARVLNASQKATLRVVTLTVGVAHGY